MRLCPFVFAGVALCCAASVARAKEPPKVDRYWKLIHDQAIVEDLKLSPQQQAAWRKALDPLDVSFFPYRGRSAAEAAAALNERCAPAKDALAKIMTPTQRERLEKLQVRLEGTEALLRDDIATKIKLTPDQQAEIAKLIADTRAAQAKVNADVVAAKLDD